MGADLQVRGGWGLGAWGEAQPVTGAAVWLGVAARLPAHFPPFSPTLPIFFRPLSPAQLASKDAKEAAHREVAALSQLEKAQEVGGWR